MRQALALARRGLGRTWPNPSVGCVIVKNGHVVGCGRTAQSGRPHAEAEALRDAGSSAKGATAYVSLEPCAVAGREGPCAQALIHAGIARVVIACIDTNPVVSGRGISMLKDAGIEVTLGILEHEAQALNHGFFLRFSEQRPLIILKTACSMDGKVALANGQSQWITGDLARRHVHSLRAQHDAVLVGIGTVNMDDPMLNARVDGLEHNTVRMILDSKLETPIDSRIVRSARDYPVWIFHEDKPVDKIRAMEAAGVRLFPITTKALKPILQQIAEAGITRVLVEGGRNIHTAFLREEFADAFYVYRAPCILGADALDAVLPIGYQDLNQAKRFQRQEIIALEQDSLEIYMRPR